MRIEDNDLCERGFGILVAELGSVEAERFIVMMNREAGDYTAWRRTHMYQGLSLQELAERARKTGATVRRMSALGV